MRTQALPELSFSKNRLISGEEFPLTVSANESELTFNDTMQSILLSELYSVFNLSIKKPQDFYSLSPQLCRLGLKIIYYIHIKL